MYVSRGTLDLKSSIKYTYVSRGTSYSQSNKIKLYVSRETYNKSKYYLYYFPGNKKGE